MVGLCSFERLSFLLLLELVRLRRGHEDHFLSWTGHERGVLDFGHLEVKKGNWSPRCLPKSSLKYCILH